MSRFSVFMCVLLLVISALALPACKSVDRYIVTQNWHDDDTLFISYREREFMTILFTFSLEDRGRIMMCRVNDDNSLNCREQEAAEAVLNIK